MDHSLSSATPGHTEEPVQDDNRPPQDLHEQVAKVPDVPPYAPDFQRQYWP